MICDKNKFLFIHIPKCAGSSVKSFLRSNLTLDLKYNEWHYSASFLEKQLENNNLYKFSLVRNPYDRLVSAFCYTIKNVKNKKNYHWKQYQNSYNIFETHYASQDIKKCFFNFVTGPHFNLIFDHGFPVHFAKQKDFLNTGIEHLDFLGQVENINDFSNKISQGIGFKISREIENINSSNSIKWNQFYNKEIKKLVYEKYKDDFLMLENFYEK